MIRAFVLFVQIAILAFGAVWLANEPGTISIVWRDWRVDPPIGVFVLAVILIVAVVALAYRAWRFVVRAPGRVVASRRVNKERKGYRALADGILALAGGDTSGALRQARKAAAMLGHPTATHLLSAQAAEQQGDAALAQGHFEAMLKEPETEFVGLQGLMRYALESDDTGAALRYARRASALRPEATWLLPQLFKLLVAAGEWADADRTIAEAIRRRAVPLAEGRRWRAAVLAHRGHLAQLEGDAPAALGFMREASDLDPSLVPASVSYASLLVQEGKTRRAIRALEHAWSLAPHPDIAEAYVRMVGGEDPIEQVKAGQRLTESGPGTNIGQLFMAEASLRGRLWGEARRYLDGVLKSRPTAKACRLMARVEEGENGDTASANHWLARTAEALPDETWMCSGCSAIAEAWAPVCGNCGAIASLEWNLPPRPASSSLLLAPSNPALTDQRYTA